MRLKNTLVFVGLVVGVPVVQAHGLNWTSKKVVPDFIALTERGYTVVADDTNVTITRGATAPANVSMLLESWHTIERSFGAQQITNLVPQPIVIQGSTGTGGSGGSTITHVTYTAVGGETDTIIVPIPLQPDTAYNGWAIQGEMVVDIKGIAMPPSLFTVNHVVLKLTAPPDVGDTLEIFIER